MRLVTESVHSLFGARFDAIDVDHARRISRVYDGTDNHRYGVRRWMILSVSME